MIFTLANHDLWPDDQNHKNNLSFMISERTIPLLYLFTAIFVVWLYNYFQLKLKCPKNIVNMNKYISALMLLFFKRLIIKAHFPDTNRAF